MQDLNQRVLDILCWQQYFLDSGPATPCYCPTVEIIDPAGGRPPFRVSLSIQIFCTVCHDWIRFGGSINHYVRHATAHLNQEAALRTFADVDGTAVGIVSKIFERGDPFNEIQRYHRTGATATTFGSTLPNSHQLVGIVYMLKERVQEAILQECAQAQYVNFALDGWSDPTLRRYQGVTARLIHPDLTVSVRLLAFKYMEHVHESRLELDRLLLWVTEKYKLKDKLLSRCTDRASINLGDANNPFRPDKFFGDCCWVPCACHLLNNFLTAFVKDADAYVQPILRLASAFRTRACFTAYLWEQKAPVHRIPKFSEVRWYSSFDLFQALETLWPFMTAYVAQERLVIPDLSQEVFEMIVRLKKLTRSFQRAQLQLESDDFGTGSRFAGHLMSVTHNVTRFAEDFHMPLKHFNASIRRFRTDFRSQWYIFVMLTILDPGVRLEIDSQDPTRIPFDQDSYDRARELLLRLVDFEVQKARHAQDQAAPSTAAVELASDDFLSLCGDGRIEILSAADQFDFYLKQRKSHRYKIDYWLHAPVEVDQLRIVAIKILSILTTSSSAERVFSIAGILCSDRQMAMTGETISSRMMVQANWEVAAALLPSVLKAGPRAWHAAEESRMTKKSTPRDTWRLDWDNLSAHIPHTPAPLAPAPIIQPPRNPGLSSSADVVHDVRSKAPPAQTKKEKTIAARIASECRDLDGELLPDAFDRIQAITAEINANSDSDSDIDWDPISDDSDADDAGREELDDSDSDEAGSEERDGSEWDDPETPEERRERIQQMRDTQQVIVANEDDEAMSARIAEEEAVDLRDATRHPVFSPKRTTKAGRGLWFPSPTGCAHPRPPEEVFPS
jgi:hypothetical protein